jgi:hypothetical protein
MSLVRLIERMRDGGKEARVDEKISSVLRENFSSNEFLK